MCRHASVSWRRACVDSGRHLSLQLHRPHPSPAHLHAETDYEENKSKAAYSVDTALSLYDLHSFEMLWEEEMVRPWG